jgi:hypothetical protein
VLKRGQAPRERAEKSVHGLQQPEAASKAERVYAAAQLAARRKLTFRRKAEPKAARRAKAPVGAAAWAAAQWVKAPESDNN